MRLILECTKCGNRVEIEPETFGNVAYVTQKLLAHDFSIFSTDFDIELQNDVVYDDNEVDCKLKEIRIDCDRCEEYICLSF